MKVTRRVALSILSAPAVMAPALAQPTGYPSRPLRLVVPFPPGGPTDVAGRLVAQRLAEALGQPVVVDNKTGAGGTLGAADVAKAAPDGYTLLYGSTSTLAIAPSIYKALAYDAAKAFQPVALVSRGRQLLVVNAQVPARTLKEFVAWTRANPDRAAYASSGIGTPGHLTAELVNTLTGMSVRHIPYKGSAPAVQAVAAGEVAFIVDNVPTSTPFIQAGRMRALAVLDRRRSPQLPEVPTFAEAGYADIEADFWSGLVVPAGTPSEIVNRLNAEVQRIAAGADFRARMAAMGAEPGAATVGEFTAFIEAETRKWAAVARSAHVTAE
jgi:tripartite-type tricarboxylate transporter receptor subunit TctC